MSLFGAQAFHQDWEVVRSESVRSEVGITSGIAVVGSGYERNDAIFFVLIP